MYQIDQLDDAEARDLAAHGKEVLRTHKDARWQGTAVYSEDKGPTWGAFDIGDIISLSSNRGFATFTKDMRVIEFEVSLDAESPRVAFFRTLLDSVTT
jgi:hypothetical protein